MINLHSNRTITARFGNGEKVFYFFPNYYHPGEVDEMIGGRFHLIKPDGTIDYVDIDYPDEEPGKFTLQSNGSGMYSAMLYQPYNQDNMPDGWSVIDRDGNTIEVIDLDCLNLDKALYDKYPSGTLFRAGERNDGPSDGGSSEICTITIRAARWNGTGWNQDTQGSKVGFDKNNMSEWEITTKARTGEVLTVYASGSSGFHSYPNDTDGWYFNPKGFYDTNHNTYKVNNDASTPNASYTFTVDGNRTIYVDFQYISQ